MNTENNSQDINLNISNKTLDIAAEGAKGFLQSLIKPSVDEIGLLFADKIKYWRFKNQVSIINKAKDYLDKIGVKPANVSLKVLCPLLEYSSLEEEESIQDKWAALLASAATNTPGTNNTLFVYILSQMSPQDCQLFDSICKLVIQEGKEKDKTVLYINIGKPFYPDQIKGINQLRVEFDNLIRLRLIAEYPREKLISPSLMWIVSDLGFAFIGATMFK